VDIMPLMQSLRYLFFFAAIVNVNVTKCEIREAIG
jgi:hypothetical protein